MFTGIIEDLGQITEITQERENVHFTVKSRLTSSLKIDQSVAHNGVCLTVVEKQSDTYRVTAIEETLQKTNLATLKVGDVVNLERAMVLGARLDGHIVQGHVDQTAKCTDIIDASGSWRYTFGYDPDLGNVTIEKGSITINGVSLTVVDSFEGGFSVAIIPYTYEHTGFKNFEIGTMVNLEFDVIGKYVKRITQGY
ncbi:MAG: riboflavin synthase [Cytophagaceae bacterium]|nr:riboflavin synthase [Cytophagaceae bacterium]